MADHYRKTPAQIYDEFGSGEKGLTSEQAKASAEKYGKNALGIGRRVSERKCNCTFKIHRFLAEDCCRFQMKACRVHYYYLFADHSILPFYNFPIAVIRPGEAEMPLIAQSADYDANEHVLDETASVRQVHADRNFLPSDHKAGKVYACLKIGC